MITPPVERVEELLVPQYQNSTNLKRYIQVFASVFQELYETFLEIESLRTIDLATGSQLDILGDLVGLKRISTTPFDGIYFGFDGEIGAETFGTIGDGDVGALFRTATGSGAAASQILDDELYRKYIEAKALRNHRRMTIPNMIDIVLYITGEPSVEITESSLSFNLHFPRTLSNAAKVRISTEGFIPKPLGIGITFTDLAGAF